jgi:signal transduction histidine kinase
MAGPVMLVASLSRNASLLGWEVDAAVNRATLRRLSLVGAMAVIVAAVAGLAYWDAERESAAALQDFAEEQATLASALGAALRVRARPDGPPAERDVMAELDTVGRPRALTVLLRRPGDPTLRTAGGREVVSPRLIQALAGGGSVVRIPREEAQAFGLPARTALAGLSHVDAGPGGKWDVVAVATAQRERDRELRAHRRLVLSVITAAGLVLAFGGVAMRNQRKELVLERELAVADLQQSRDERLQRANKAAVMGTLAMGVAHEIATPLGVIAARAEQMKPRVEGDERLAASVAAILSQTERINQVIRGLLGLARGDAPSVERIDPRALVDNAVGLVEHRFAKAGVALTADVDLDVPAVIGDPRLLEHALVNLLLNACDACKTEGEVGIRVHRDAGEVEIRVDDTGTGISPADVGRALEPFFTTKARDGGTGLGLAIAQEIVASHRGTLLFAPGSPRGTRASIRLPPADGAGHA